MPKTNLPGLPQQDDEEERRRQENSVQTQSPNQSSVPTQANLPEPVITVQVPEVTPPAQTQPLTSTQQLKSKVVQPTNKWYKGDTPTNSETLAQIYRISQQDPAQGETLFNQYQAYTQDPSNPLYNPYNTATNTAINELSKLGYDISGGVTQEWLENNRGLEQYLQYNSAGNIQAPSRRSNKQQKAAYYYYQLLLAEGTTEQAETEWSALKEEISYWTGRRDLNLSDDEILAKIDWSQYKTLTGMDEGRKTGKPTELNRSVGYDQDALTGVIWAARNGVKSDDGFNSVRAALGMGHSYERKDEIKNKLDPSSADFAPYSVCTLDDAARYFGVDSFDKGWLEANRGYAFSQDETAKKYFEKVYKAELTTETAEAEIEALNAEIEKRLKYYPDDPDKILSKIDWDKDYPTLKKMNETMRGGSLLMTTRPIDFRKEDLEQSVRDRCAKDETNWMDKIRAKLRANDYSGETEISTQNRAADLLRAARPTLMDSGTDTERGLLDSGYGPTSSGDMTSIADGIDSGNIDGPSSVDEAYGSADRVAMDNYLDAYGVTQEYNTAKDKRDSAAKNIELLMQGIIPDELKEKYPQFFQNDATPIPATEEPETEEEEAPTTSSAIDTYKSARDLPKGLTTANAGFSDVGMGGNGSAAAYEGGRKPGYAMPTEGQASGKDEVVPAETEAASSSEADLIQKLINMEQNQLDENQARMDELEEKEKNALSILEEIYNGYDGADQIAALLGEDPTGRRQTLAELDYYFELGKDYVPTDRSDYSLYDYYLQEGADPVQVGEAAKARKFNYQVELLQIDKVLKSLEEKGFNFNKEYFSTDGKYQFYNNIQRRKEYLQREIQAADYYQIRNSADFSEVVADGKEKITSAWGNAWNRDTDILGIDSTHDGYSRLSWTAAAPEHGITFQGSGTGDTKMYALSQEERDTYIYIREKQGEDAAKAYYDYLTNDDYGIVTNRMAYELRDTFTTPEGEDWGWGDFGKGALRTGATILASPLKILGSIYSVAQKVQGKEINPNSAAFGVDILTGAVRNDFKNQITNTFGEGSFGDVIGNLGFDVLISAGDSWMNGLTFGGLGGGLADKATAAKEAGHKLAAYGFKAGSSLVSASGMGLGAAGGAIRDAKLRGATDDQALMVGGLTFICETITEAFTIDNMAESFGFGVEDLTAKDAKAWMKFLSKLGTKYLDEPLAEGINEIMEGLGDEFIMGELSNYSQRVKELEDTGMLHADADRMARYEFWKDVGFAAATGGLSSQVTNISAYLAGRFSGTSGSKANTQQNQVRVDDLGNIITEETGTPTTGPYSAPATEGTETTTAPETEETTAEEAPAAEEAATEEAPATTEETTAEEAPAIEEAATEETPATEEAPAAEEVTTEETPAAEEATTEEAPAAEEASATEEAATEEAAPATEENVTPEQEIEAREATVEERGNVQEPTLPELATAVGNEMADVFGSSEEFYAVRDETQAAADSLDALEKAITTEETAKATAEAEAAEADAARNSAAYVMSAMQQAYQSTKLALSDAIQGLVERGVGKVHQFALNKAYKNIESWSQLYDQAAAEYQKIVDQYNEIVHARETYEAIQKQYDQESRAGAIDDDGLSVYNDQLNEAAYKYKVLGGEEMEAQLKRGLSWTVADRQGYANEGAEAATKEYQSLQEGQEWANNKADQYFASFKQNLKEAGRQLLDACKTGFKALRYAVNSLRTPAQQTKPSNPNNPAKVVSQLSVLGSAQEADAGGRTAAIGAVLLPSGQRDLYSLGTASTAAQYLTNKYGPSAVKTLRNLILDANETNRSTDEITSAISTAALSDNPEVQEKLDAVMTGNGTDFDLDSMISMTRDALKDPTSVELMRQKVRNNMIGRRTLDLIGRGALNSVAPYEQQVDHAKAELDNANADLEQAEETQEQMQNNLVDAQQSWLAELDKTLRNDKTIAALKSNVTTALNALQGQIKVAAEYAQRQQNAETAYKEAQDQLDMKRDEALAPVREQAEAEVDAELNAEAEEAERLRAEQEKAEQEAATAAALDQAAKEKAETDFAEYQEAVTNLTPAAEAGRMIETTQKNGKKIKLTGVAYMKDGGRKIYYTTDKGKIISSDTLTDPNGVSGEVTGDFDDDAWDRAEGAEGPAVPLDTSITVEESDPEGKKKRPKRKEVIGIMPSPKGGDTQVMFSDGTTGVWEDYNPVRKQDVRAFNDVWEAHEDELDKAYKKQKPGLRPKPYEAPVSNATTVGESADASTENSGVNAPEEIQNAPTKPKTPTDRTENTVQVTPPTETEAVDTSATEDVDTSVAEEALTEADELNTTPVTEEETQTTDEGTTTEPTQRTWRNETLPETEEAAQTADDNLHDRLLIVARNRGLSGQQAENFATTVMSYARSQQVGNLNMTQPMSNSEGLLFTRALGRRFGVNIKMGDLGNGVNGSYDAATNTITLNKNQPAGRVAMEFALHELTHALEQTGSYQKYSDTVMNSLFNNDERAKTKAINDKIVAYAGMGEKITAKQAEREIVADFTRTKLSSKPVVERMLDAGLGGRIRNALHNINQYFKNMTSKMSPAERKMAEALRKAERVFQKAINERRTAPTTGQTTANVSHSLAGGELTSAEMSQALNEASGRTSAADAVSTDTTTAEAPVRTGQRQFGRQTAQTSEDLNQQTKDYLYNHSEYTKDSNDAQINRAIQWVHDMASENDPNGYHAAVAAVTSDGFDYRSADGQARMLTVMSMAAQQNDLSTEMLLADAFNKQGTDLGQQLQARKLFRMMNPIGRMALLQRMVDQINDMYAQAGSSEQVGLSDFTLEAAAQAETEEDFERVRKAAQREIADQMPANWKEKLQSWRMLSMLMNTRTHIRNVLGNALFAPAVGIKNKLGAAVEIGTFQKERTKTLSPFLSRENRQFARQDAIAMRSVLTGEAKYNDQGVIRQNRKVFGKFLQALSDFNSGALEKEDWIFLKGHYRRALGGWMQANKYTPAQLRANPQLLEKGRAYAISEAQKATYRDANKLANTLNKIGRDGGVAGFLVNATLPFKTTPANILKRGLEYSPIGIVKSLTADAVHLKQYNDYQKGKLSTLPEKAISPNQWINNMCAGLTGTGILALGMLLSNMGVISVGLDDDDDEFEKLEGGQEYAAKISIFGNDYTFTLDWAAPICMPFFVGAAIQEQMNNENQKIDPQEVINALASITEPVFNLSMLDGVNSLFRTSQYDDTNTLTQIGAKIVTNYTTSYVPSALGAVARSRDPIRRKAFVKSGESSGLLGQFRYAREQVENKIPGLSESNIPLRDAFGRIDEATTEERLLENFILPGYLNKVEKDPVVDEMKRLYEMTKKKEMIPELPSKTLTVKGDKKSEKIALDAEQYDKLTKERGETAYSLIKSLMSTPYYRQMDDDDREKVIEDAWTYATQQANHKINKRANMDSWVLNSATDPVKGILNRWQSQVDKEYKDGCKKEAVKAVTNSNWEALDVAIEKFIEAGGKKSSIKTAVTNEYRPKYIRAYQAGDRATMAEIEDLLYGSDLGYDDVKDFEAWIENMYKQTEFEEED